MKKIKYPTPKKLKEWASQFTSIQWGFLCENQDFLDIVTVNTETAQVLANNLLKEFKE
jgi:hypothetical protein